MAMDSTPASRNQKIFTLGLSVETVSLYLLCCGLADEGRRISIKDIRRLWNAGEEALQTSLEELEQRNILRKIVSDEDGQRFYGVVGVEKWRLSSA